MSRHSTASHNLPTDPRVSVTMGRSKGLAESTEVYPVENLFPQIILLVLALSGYFLSIVRETIAKLAVGI